MAAGEIELKWRLVFSFLQVRLSTKVRFKGNGRGLLFQITREHISQEIVGKDISSAGLLGRESSSSCTFFAGEALRSFAGITRAREIAVPDVHLAFQQDRL
jgi:hypothetical protein